jgi:hypothetical protein
VDPQTSIYLGQLEEFFNREFERYTNTQTKILQLEINNYPSSLADGLSKQANVLHLFLDDSIFSFFEERGLKPQVASDATIYVYLFPFEPRADTQLSFPQYFQGKRSQMRGLVFAPAHPSKRTSTLLAIAEELGRVFGATPKKDPVTQMPLFPSGFPQPLKNPLFPQDQAELMAGTIALDSLSKRTPENFGEVAVGPQTAFEFGWISSSQRNDLIGK